MIAKDQQLSFNGDSGSELPDDTLVDILEFLPTNDFTQARLTNKQWWYASMKCNDTWMRCYDQLVHHSLPRSHLFGHFSIVSDHPLFKSHPMLQRNQLGHMSRALGMDPTTHTDWEMEQEILDGFRSEVDTHLEAYLDELTMKDGEKKLDYYTGFCLVLSFVKQKQLSVGSREQYEYWIGQGLTWHHNISVIKLLSLPIIGLLTITFCILAFLKGLHLKDILSWNTVFPFLYAAWAIKYGLDTIHYFQHMFFWKASIHTRVTVHKLAVDILFTASMLIIGLVTILLFHLRSMGIEPWSSSATLSLVPVMIELAILYLAYFIVYWRTVSRSLSFMLKAVVVSLWIFVVMEGMLILLGFRMDGMVRVNYAVFLIPVDIAFTLSFLQSCLCCTVSLFKCGRKEMRKQTIKSIDIFHHYITTAYLFILVMVQVIIGISDWSNYYVFICLSVLTLLWCLDTGFLIKSEDPELFSFLHCYTARDYQQYKRVHLGWKSLDQ